MSLVGHNWPYQRTPLEFCGQQKSVQVLDLTDLTFLASLSHLVGSLHRNGLSRR